MKSKSSSDPDKGDKRGREDGILKFLAEIHRISRKEGISLWCTPGHNRGIGLEPRHEKQLPLNAAVTLAA